MKVKTLKEYLKLIDDDVEVTFVTFDYKTGTQEFYLNLACTQANPERLRFTQSIFCLPA